MTLPEIHDYLREGWLETDAYRAYEQWRTRRRVSGESGNPPYGSPDFRERARHWWIRGQLQDMLKLRTARREGAGAEARWFAGDRAPRLLVACPVHGHHLAPLDAVAQAKADNTVRAGHIRREQVKAELLEGLNDRRLSQDRARELIQLAYNYISGH
jgi:hypothetical protein